MSTKSHHFHVTKAQKGQKHQGPLARNNFLVQDFLLYKTLGNLAQVYVHSERETDLKSVLFSFTSDRIGQRLVQVRK